MMALSALLVICGVILLMVWAARHLSAQRQLWAGCLLILLGLLLTLLSHFMTYRFGMMGGGFDGFRGGMMQRQDFGYPGDSEGWQQNGQVQGGSMMNRFASGSMMKGGPVRDQ